MTQPRPLIRPRTWIFLALFLLALGGLAHVLTRAPLHERVLILASPLDNRGRNVGPGMGTLLADLLEIQTGATVAHAPVLPSPEELNRLAPNTQLLRFQGRRDGDLLALTVEWTSVSRLLAGRPWVQDTAPPQEPRQALDRVTQHWSLMTRHRHMAALIPKSPARFWLLLEGLSIQDDATAVAHLDASQRLVEAEPGCATAWTALGDHLYRSLWVNPEQAGIGLNSRIHRVFQKAVELVPGHPRATFLWSLMLTDTGNQGLALQSIRKALRLRPGMADLYLGAAYAGRTAGLLEGAQRALTRRGELLDPLPSPSGWLVETTYLYLGDRGAFEKELARVWAFRQDSATYFYQGYFALLQGRLHQALEFMRSGSEAKMTPIPFRDLCRVYRAYLEGRLKEGLADLREIDETRGKLRIPDGEWTFKEAEAYALLGDADRSLDCATRAFVQGFSCSAWYEASPFLAKVREHPRWPMLRRNIRERQAMLEGSFPPSAFTP